MTVTIRILSSSEHCLSRNDVDPDALKIIHRLHRMGFLAYLCGGAVRDLLLGRKPKDFDIVTDARPGQIRKRFHNVFIIGRRFRLAHVHFPGGKIIEVATFRRDLAEEERAAATERIAPELMYGTPREDAFRRDVTINSLYYDAVSGEIIDYVGGLDDLASRRVRLIGDPASRYTEDAVRIWRVVRYAARLGFEIEEETARAIPAFAPLLGKCAGARLYEELNKELGERTRPVMDALRARGLLRYIIGGFGEDYENDGTIYERLREILENKDRLQKDGLELTREECYALLFWPWAEAYIDGKDGGFRERMEKAFESAGTQAVFPKKMKTDVVQILTLIVEIFKAFRNSRANYVIPRHAAFPSAFVLFGLIMEGRPGDPEKMPANLFGRLHPAVEDKAPAKKRRRRRPRKPRKQSPQE